MIFYYDQVLYHHRYHLCILSCHQIYHPIHVPYLNILCMFVYFDQGYNFVNLDMEISRSDLCCFWVFFYCESNAFLASQTKYSPNIFWFKGKVNWTANFANQVMTETFFHLQNIFLFFFEEAHSLQMAAHTNPNIQTHNTQPPFDSSQVKSGQVIITCIYMIYDIHIVYIEMSYFYRPIMLYLRW